MKLKRSVCYLFILILGCVAGRQMHSQEIIEYVIKPKVHSHGLDLNISSKFKLNDELSILIKLPTDNYGNPDIHQYLKSIKGVNGTALEKTEDSLALLAIPNKSGEINIEYSMAYGMNLKRAFAPVVSQEYFSLAGCQWLLHIGSDEKERFFSIKFDEIPLGWNTHSSLGPLDNNFHIKATYDDMITSRIGGGGDQEIFLVEQRPIRINVKGDFDLDNSEIFESVRKIVAIQREWFNDYDQPFFNVIINAKREGSVVAGTAVENQFVCFVRKDVSKNRLNYLLAHEMFHYWLPEKIAFNHIDGHHKKLFEWFTEGFTTYFAKKILYDAGIISKEFFADLINEEIKDIVNSPIKNITAEEIIEADRTNKFTSEFKKLAYWRGAILALIWEAELQNKHPSKTLSHYIRALYEYGEQGSREISFEDFKKFTSEYGINFMSSYQKHLLEGNDISIQKIPKELESDFIISKKTYTVYHMGFNTIATIQDGVIRNVEKESIAYEAGLRNGMKYLRIKNRTRGANGWDSERPFIIKVIDEGKEKQISFVPSSSTITIPSIEVKD